MATLREYFETDSKLLSIHNDWQVSGGDGTPRPPVTAKILRDHEGNAKYWAFFVPTGSDVRACVQALLKTPETSRCVLRGEHDEIETIAGFAGYSEHSSSKTLVFSGRVFLYIDETLSDVDRRDITAFGAGLGFFVLIRDRSYAVARSNFEKPLAFISHDSRDKDALVRELARELSRLLCPVWYDEYSLKVGDSLRSTIEKGLKEAKRCILVLSPNFIGNGGWGRAEFDSIFTREILEKKNVILPVWHNVGVKDVYEYSPRLADRVALNSSIGVKELAGKLSHAVTAADDS